MHLLYIHDNPLTSEQANLIQVIHMCQAFSQNKIEVTLALPESPVNEINDYHSFLAERFGFNPDFSIKTYKKISLFGRFNFAGGYLGVKKLLRGSHADLCFIRNASFLGAVISKGIPFLFESHNTIIHIGSELMNRFWIRRVIKYANNPKCIGFITISQALADHWKSRGIPGDKILALHDGFSESKFEKVKDKVIARKELRLPDDRKIVMYLGSLYADRGIETILDLAKNFTTANFVIVGGPEAEKEHYENLASKLGLANVFFIGRIDHHMVPDYLYAADTLLMIWTDKVKTINYCSPLKTFEYMATGRTIVGHAFPTIKEVLENGKNALLANPNSFDELKNKLNIALTLDDKSDIGRNARILAYQRYSWRQRAKTILKSSGFR